MKLSSLIDRVRNRLDVLTGGFDTHFCNRYRELSNLEGTDLSGQSFTTYSVKEVRDIILNEVVLKTQDETLVLLLDYLYEGEYDEDITGFDSAERLFCVGGLC